MPSPTLRRSFYPESYHHIYNRGIRKLPIFLKEKDYWIFRRYCNETLERFEGDVTILAFALLENHFHLLLFQESERGISKFMRSFVAKYRRYIKEKYHIDGPFFGARYQSKVIKKPSEIEKIRKYILNNPIEAGLTDWPHVGSKM